MSVLVILLKCKAVICLEAAEKVYAKGEFLSFLLPPFLSLPSPVNVYSCFVLL